LVVHVLFVAYRS